MLGLSMQRSKRGQGLRLLVNFIDKLKKSNISQSHTRHAGTHTHNYICTLAHAHTVISKQGGACKKHYVTHLKVLLPLLHHL